MPSKTTEQARNQLGRFDKKSIQIIAKFCKNCDVVIPVVVRRDIDRKNYCSRSCASKGGARTEAFRCNVSKKCGCCGQTFESVRYSQKYCSSDCCSRMAENAYKDRTATVDGFLRRLTRTDHRRSSLTTDFLIQLYKNQNGKCAVSGVGMTALTNKGRINTNISIDRIDSSKGYDPDNVQLVCRIVNLMKHNMTVDELKKWCRSIVQHNGG